MAEEKRDPLGIVYDTTWTDPHGMTPATTAPTIRDLFDPAALNAAVVDGYVRKQVHPTEPLVILNYSEKAAYENAWDDVTLTCRGLIYNTDTLAVVARPLKKFFNHGQLGAPPLDLGGEVVVTDKLDGSLGILYPLAAGGWAVATRGSFASDQAEHATKIWRERYAERVQPRWGYTYLFEIVYPANRIVVDYGDMDDLVMLGAVDLKTGWSIPHAGWWARWPGPRAEEFPYSKLAEALAAPPRPNREGLVVHFTRTDERVKLKQADYVALHRIVTGLTARTVWQHLVDGKPLADLIAPLPDEFHQWVRDIADGIAASVQRETWRLEGEYTRIRDAMPDGWQLGDRASRAEFAKVAANHPDSWAMFALLDGKDIGPKLLHNAKPEPYLTPSGRTYTEDNA